MAGHKTVKPEESEIKRAEKLWSSFTQTSKVAVIATAAVLILMLIFLV